MRVSWKHGASRSAARRSSPARDFEPVMAAIEKIHAEVLRGRVWVALHMHAGDGNVHTNIPVNSDNYEMLQTANAAVARIMKLARALDGVISGEHGIGITKLEFLEPDEIAAFIDYKQRVDPEGRFNRGKLLRGRRATLQADLTNAYTPCFGADRPRVADHASRATSARSPSSFKDCLRCGKCKPRVHDARAAREPALQPEQQDPRDVAAHRGLPLRGADAPRRLDPPLGRVRRRGRPLHGLPQVPVACPVDIDFGDVSIEMRNLLAQDAARAASIPATWLAMMFLNATRTR